MPVSTFSGNPETFAIEFARGKSPNYIHARLWISGHWVGDFNDTLMPEPMCAYLLCVACLAIWPPQFYVYEEEGPTWEALVDQGYPQFGESFDPFWLSLYAVLSSKLVHLQWQLAESYYRHFPDYPRQHHHFAIGLNDFRTALRPFIQAMIDGGYYVQRRGMPSLADLDRSEANDLTADGERDSASSE